MAHTYTIKENRENGEHLQTVVEYDFDGTKVTVDQPHFQPADKAKVIAEIKDRAVSEKKKLDAIAKNKLLKTELDKDINKPTPMSIAIEE